VANDCFSWLTEDGLVFPFPTGVLPAVFADPAVIAEDSSVSVVFLEKRLLAHEAIIIQSVNFL
jgi:hypothetical protein